MQKLILVIFWQTVEILGKQIFVIFLKNLSLKKISIFEFNFAIEQKFLRLNFHQFCVFVKIVFVIFYARSASAVLLVILPLTFIQHTAILCVCQHTMAMPLSIQPLTHVLSAFTIINHFPSAANLAISEIAFVFILFKILKNSFTVFFVLLPFSVIHVTVFIYKFTSAMLAAVFEFALINIPILIFYESSPFKLITSPIALNPIPSWFINKFSLSMFQSVFDCSLVAISVAVQYLVAVQL